MEAPLSAFATTVGITNLDGFEGKLDIVDKMLFILDVISNLSSPNRQRFLLLPPILFSRVAFG